jgi:hypothetical protein
MKQYVGFTQVDWDCINPNCGKETFPVSTGGTGNVIFTDSGLGFDIPITTLNDMIEVVKKLLHNQTPWYQSAHTDIGYNLDTAQGAQLDSLANMYGIVRKPECPCSFNTGSCAEETDIELRTRIQQLTKLIPYHYLGGCI